MKAKEEILLGDLVEKEEEYPVYKVSTNFGNIVRFSAPNKGIYVGNTGDRTSFRPYRFGHGSGTWTESDFIPFTGKIILSNK